MKTLKQLCEISAVSGFEKRALNDFSEVFSNYGFTSVKTDEYGNIYGEKINPQNKINILIDAHIDEIGLIVKKIEKNGFILFDNIGGIDKNNLYCREVTIFGKKEVYGVIGATPPHLRKEDEETLYIDTGLKNADEIISVGDPIKLKSNFLKLKNSCVSSGVLDNRAGLFCALNSANKMDDNVNITVLGSVREEMGTQGVDVFLKDKKYDLAIVIDVTHGYFDGLKDYRSYPLGEGFTICYGGILDNEITKKIENHLIKNEIPFNTEFEPEHPGTNAFKIIHHDIPVIMLSIPLKYMHTTCETVSMKDIKGLYKFISSFDWENALNKGGN